MWRRAKNNAHLRYVHYFISSLFCDASVLTTYLLLSTYVRNVVVVLLVIRIIWKISQRNHFTTAHSNRKRQTKTSSLGFSSFFSSFLAFLSFFFLFHLAAYLSLSVPTNYFLSSLKQVFQSFPNSNSRWKWNNRRRRKRQEGNYCDDRNTPNYQQQC